ncbi:hypothetical protein [Microbacterium arborescens]|uniref:hypothetical protein n=1 Tax=Microbacterium arborescens TaxID=33883 RepID=UPI000DF7F7DB|nr:hypothetical protein [Microbacterium arborescens]
MFTINGVPLTNGALGWLFRPGSQPFITLEAQVAAVTTVGQRGVTPFQTGVTAALWSCVVFTPDAHREALNALFGQPKLLLSPMAKPSRVAEAQFMTSEVDRVFARGEAADMRYSLMLLDAAWRDRNEVTTPAAGLSAASVQVSCMAADGGLSAPVDDAIIRVKGAVTSLRVTDSGGSWLSFPSIPANQWLRFHADTGRAFLTATDTWTGGTEVSGEVDYGGPTEQFEITPVFPNPLDPSTREGRVTFTTASRTGASAQIRARAAYVN